MPALEELILAGNPLTDLKGLAEAAPGLTSLDLSQTDLVDLSGLAGLKHLQSLNLNECRRLTGPADKGGPLEGVNARLAEFLCRAETTEPTDQGPNFYLEDGGKITFTSPGSYTLGLFNDEVFFNQTDTFCPREFHLYCPAKALFSVVFTVE